MSYQVLARKWRPKRFQDVIGQAHITQSLQNAIEKNKVGHAYMMVGTRGVGKTSVARIFAKALRCEKLTPDLNPCEKCSGCLDFDTDTSMNVIEIDGASNNSVDNIRELISNVHYLPTTGKYKIYIIDEVHMLSTNAFNALLKTLEEPPAHVVFIFATTEAQKLLGTVLSRCQRFDFRNVSLEDLSKHIEEIAKAEKINFETNELIKIIASQGRGSVRDTLSIFDQVLTFSQNNLITEKTLTSTLGIAGPKTIQQMKELLFSGNNIELSRLFNKLIAENIPAKNIAVSLLDSIYKSLLETKELSEAELIWIYETISKETSWIFHSIVPDKALEVLLHKVALRRTFFTNQIIQSEPREQSPQPEEVISTISEKQVKTSPEDHNWEGFLSYLSSKSPASASNLEQGNLLSPIVKDANHVAIELGFNPASIVFLDYLKEPEVFLKLQTNLADYFSVEKERVHLELKEVSTGDHLVTRAEIREQVAQVSIKEKIEEFKNNPLLKEAEKIFNSKVDKVIIEQKK